jgi:hypothetical protein
MNVSPQPASGHLPMPNFLAALVSGSSSPSNLTVNRSFAIGRHPFRSCERPCGFNRGKRSMQRARQAWMSWTLLKQRMEAQAADRPAYFRLQRGSEWLGLLFNPAHQR